MIRVGIISASGYAGVELVRYLLGHPAAKITYLSSKTYARQPLSNAYPSLLGCDLPPCEEYNPEAAAERADILFQAHGNGVGMKLAPPLLERGKKFVDMPADFRLKDADVYREYYGIEHSAIELLSEAVYGIPELHAAEIANARIVANPGCYATGAILALAPLVAERVADIESIVIDSKSGVSGAGRSKVEVSNLFTEVNEGFKAYAVARHRHTPEIEQELSLLAGRPVNVTFTPHLVPMNRGILTTNYVRLQHRGKNLVALYRDFYAGKRFVIVLDEGTQPNTKNVLGTNYCHIGVAADERTGTAIITSAIDNMGKGAAGQAVQNMNLLYGLDEWLGLTSPAVFP